MTANVCFGTAAKAREKLDPFFAGLAERKAEVQQRCRTTLQARAEELISTAKELFAQPNHVDFTLASVQALSYTQTLRCDRRVHSRGLPVHHGTLSPVERMGWLWSKTGSREEYYGRGKCTTMPAAPGALQLPLPVRCSCRCCTAPAPHPGAL